MRAVLQKVKWAKVTVETTVVGQIGPGLLALVGFAPTDGEETMDYMLDKMIRLRIFPDEQEKMNLSLVDVGGGLLLVPNFTLYGDARKGRRPSYNTGAAPEQARTMYTRLMEKAAQTGLETAGGIFQSHMEVELCNDGPVTLLLDSDRGF